MARITVEDCLKCVDNRFELIHLAAKRVRQLRKGAEPMVVCKNKDIVVSLREIAEHKIFQTSETDQPDAIEMMEDAAAELPEPSEELSETEDKGKDESGSEDKQS